MQPFSCQRRKPHISKAWFLEHVHFLIWNAAIADESFSRSAEKISFLQLEPKKLIVILIQRALSFESVASFLWTCLLDLLYRALFSGIFDSWLLTKSIVFDDFWPNTSPTYLGGAFHSFIKICQGHTTGVFIPHYRPWVNRKTRGAWGIISKHLIIFEKKPRE